MEIFVNQLEDVIKQFPKFKIVEFEGVIILSGEIDIIDSQGRYWESYNIEIKPHNDFPKRFPILYEIGGKIPKIADWHIYEDTFSCCVAVLPIELAECKKGITVLKYIQLYALPYLFNQTHRRQIGYYPAGEYSHGILGLQEYYTDLFKNKNIEKVITWIWNVSDGKKYSRTSSCFCGSKKKYRHCHRDAVKLLQMIEPIELKKHVKLIFERLEKIKNKF